MSQAFEIPSGNDSFSVAVATKTAGSIQALRSMFAGATEPASAIRVGWMPWGDEATGRLRVRDASNSAWLEPCRQVEKLDERGWDASAFSVFLAPPIQKATLERVRILSTTASTGSVASTTEYVFDIFNVTDSASLFSAAPSTATAVGGVGGGEIAANVAYDLVPNQNQTVAVGDALEFRVTVNGTPTTLTRASVWALWLPRFD